MTGVCPACGASYPLPGSRGTRVGDYHCRVDGVALVGPRALACPVRGRYEQASFSGGVRTWTGDCGEPRGHAGVCRTSSGHVLRAAPTEGLTMRARPEGGYEALAGDAPVGTLMPFYLPSHIRRGRAQASPWWRATAADGTLEGDHQRRVDALAALAWVAAGRPG